uniref:Uncharacterized protein n=1 Tax=Peronospora matthiolae TaxID=2874970 RepID=A0AAV1TLZ9_9STRA
MSKGFETKRFGRCSGRTKSRGTTAAVTECRMDGAGDEEKGDHGRNCLVQVGVNVFVQIHALRVKQLSLQGMHDFASGSSTMKQAAEQGVPIRVLNQICLPETDVADDDDDTGRTGSDKAQMLHLKPGRSS